MGSELPERPRGENTRAVHLPPPPVPAQQPVGAPLYRTAAFAFKSAAEGAAVLSGEIPGFSYSRIDNPTVEAFTAAVAAMEGFGLGREVAGQAFASGMGAVSTVFWALTGAGAHVVAPVAMYGGSYGFLRNVASRFGVRTSFTDITDLDGVASAVRPGTAVLYAETLANPTTAVADLPALAEIAHRAGALFVVDSTLAPPPLCRPLAHGADLVLHSATKYIGGHSDVTGGVASGDPKLIARVRAVRVDTGASLSPDDAYLLRRGLETLPLRLDRACATALALAEGVAGHPAVLRVDYPGLPDHPGHKLAARLLRGRFGALLTITPRGGREAGMAFADRLRVARVATSLGGTRTKVSHVATTSHRQLDDAALRAAGIDPGAVRFSVGLEDADDLVADVRAALDGLTSG
jgi:cystathionine beta-lyase/cystathionine gamma-synthase